MSTFAVENLRPDQIRAVYPLIREAMRATGLQTWIRFARQLMTPRRGGQAGIVAARRRGRDFPCGLFCYRVDNDLEHGRVLIAEHFVAIDVLGPDAVLSALVEELEALGKRLGCTAIRSVVHGGENSVAGGLAAAGHAPEGSLMLKPLPESMRRPGADSPAHC
jgi:hypothetical protein